MKISASILSCDLLRLVDDIKRLEDAGANSLHVDIMDGAYVDNFAFGVNMVERVKGVTRLPLEVHLEINNGDRHIETFARAGADTIILQADTVRHPIRALETIRGLGLVAGYAVNPAEEVPRAILSGKYIDYLLVMTAEPGFGGQKMNEDCLYKVKEAKQGDPEITVGVDGGVNQQNFMRLYRLGVDVAVMGTAVFRGGMIEENLRSFHELEEQENRPGKYATI
ncbi:ribulose-phosphate 3-epimerase [Christensenella timonensis]|uniref:ribulose-phosphate 3-epimerase n=1 Tax=Christensenella timonensis TaxID=1816678 RepID=UPI00082E8A34|nr:ribulose-phosphate 3-epimerase [Christensenella timonensis]